MRKLDVLSEIAKQSFEGVAWLLLTACSKVRKREMKLLNKVISELRHLKNSQLIHIVKIEKTCSKMNNRVAEHGLKNT